MNTPTLRPALLLALCAAPQLARSQDGATKEPAIIPVENAQTSDQFTPIERVVLAEVSPRIDTIEDTSIAQESLPTRTITRVGQLNPSGISKPSKSTDSESSRNVDVEVLAFAANPNTENDGEPGSEGTELKVIVNQNGETKSFKWNIGDLQGDKMIRQFIDTTAKRVPVDFGFATAEDQDFIFEFQNPIESPSESGAWLGVIAAEISPDVANQLPIRKGSGLIIRSLVDEAPAAVSGLKQRDVLYKIDDQILFTVPQLVQLIQSYEPGDKINLTAYRKGKEHGFSVELGERAAQPTQLITENYTTNPPDIVGHIEHPGSEELIIRKFHSGPVTIVESDGKVKVLKPDAAQIEKDVEQSIKKALKAIEIDTKTLDKILEVLNSELKFD